MVSMKLAQPLKAHFLFFGLASLFAIFVVAATVAYHANGFDWPGPPIGPWHGHEMIFGFALAVMGGYFSGAIRGPAALLLVAAWLIARIAALSLTGQPWVMTAMMVIYPALLFFYAGLPLLRSAKSWRNAVFGYILAAFPVAELLLNAPIPDTWQNISRPTPETGIMLVCLMLFAMGGRIIAAATSGALRARGLSIFNPAQPQLEKPGILILALLVVAEAVRAPGAIVSLLSAMVAAIVVVRLARWRFWSIRDLSVLSLQAGYAWLTAGFALKAAAPYIRGVSPTDILHALTVGALGTLTLAVMVRIVLQRARQPVTPGLLGLTPIVLVNAAALLRTAAPLTDLWLDMVTLAAFAWCAAFALFLAFLLREGPLASHAHHR